MPLLFLYGTLMRRGANHAVLRRLGARFVAEARTHAPRVLVDLGPYPALLPATPPSDASSCVSGELWDLDDDGLTELDAFEGVPELYTRELVELDHGGGVLALTYVLAGRVPASARVLSGGRYDVGAAASERAPPRDPRDD